MVRNYSHSRGFLDSRAQEGSRLGHDNSSWCGIVAGMGRVFPAPRAGEFEMLTGWLDWQRATVPRKVLGLDDGNAYRALIATSPKMTVAGVLSHLRWTEWGWFARSFPSLAGEVPQSPADVSDWSVEGEPTVERLIAEP